MNETHSLHSISPRSALLIIEYVGQNYTVDAMEEEEKNPQLPFCCKWWIYTVMGYMKKRYQNRIQSLTNMFNNEHCFKSACALDRNFEMLSVIGIDFSNVNTSDPLVASDILLEKTIPTHMPGISKGSTGEMERCSLIAISQEAEGNMSLLREQYNLKNNACERAITTCKLQHCFLKYIHLMTNATRKDVEARVSKANGLEPFFAALRQTGVLVNTSKLYRERLFLKDRMNYLIFQSRFNLFLEPQHSCT